METMNAIQNEVARMEEVLGKIEVEKQALRGKLIEVIRNYLTDKDTIHLYDFDEWSTSNDVMDTLFEIYEVECFDFGDTYATYIEGLELGKDGDILAVVDDGETLSSDFWRYDDAVNAFGWLNAYDKILKKRSAKC